VGLQSIRSFTTFIISLEKIQEKWVCEALAMCVCEALALARSLFYHLG